MLSRPPLLALLFALALLLWPGASAAQAQGDRARELFRAGIEASQQERWEDARRALAEALELERKPVILYSLAVAERNTGRVVAALGHFREFLRTPPDPRLDSFRQPAEEAVAELEARVARVIIEVRPRAPRGLTVRLDGEDLAPEVLGRAQPVDPGEHTVAATAPGHREARAELRIGPGAEERVRLVLQPQPTAPEPTPDELPIAPIALMSVGGACLLGGAAVGVVGMVEASQIESSAEREAIDAARVKAIAGDVIGGAGAIALGVGFVLFMLDGGESSESAARPWSAAPGGGMAFRY